MAIEYVGKSAFAASTGALSVGAVPGVQAGDLILLFAESANQTVALPSGFTGAPGSPVGSGTAGTDLATRISVFYRIATGADSSTSVSDSGDHTVAFKLAYRNVDASVPIEANASVTRNTPINLPAVTTVTANAMVLYAIAISEDYNVAHPAVTLPSVATLTGLSVPHAQVSSQGTGGGIGVITGFKAAPGDTGSGSADYGFSAALAILALSLRPVLGDITGTSAIAETTFDSASAASAVVVSAQSSASDQRDTSTATASVRAVRYATASVADAADISTASAIVVVPPVPSTPAPFGDWGELARHELAANALALGAGATYAQADLTAGAAATATFAGASINTGAMQAAAAASTVLRGALTYLSAWTAAPAATTAFTTDVAIAASAGFAMSATTDFLASYTFDAEMTASAVAEGLFAFAEHPELHGRAKASAAFVGAYVKESSVVATPVSTFSAQAAWAAPAQASATAQSEFTARGQAVATAELYGGATATINLRGAYAQARVVQMAAGASFAASGQAVATGGWSAAPKATTALQGDFGLSTESIGIFVAGAAATFRSGAVHQAGLAASTSAGFNAGGSEVRAGRFITELRARFMPDAGNPFSARLDPADETVLVPLEPREALVPYEHRMAEEGA